MVSAIILSYNRSDEVLKTVSILKELKKTLPFDLEIIVVNNGSADDTATKLKHCHPDINLISKAENNGIAGWNEGFKVAGSKYFLVLDDDSHLKDGLAGAIDFIEKDPAIGILALNIKGGKYETNTWVPGGETIGFIGCGAIIKRELFETIGGFAEWIYTNAHEWEYGIRCMDAGYKIIYFNKSSVIHRSDSEALSNHAIAYSTRNEMGIVYKYFKTNRFKYLVRTFLNNTKVIRTHGFIAGCHSVLGAIKFLRLCNKLNYTPVSQQTQDFFSARFWGTQPVFNFLRPKVKGRL